MANVMSGGRGSRAGIVGINVTPMVDVVLVLLVIMMVSATYIVSQSLRVNLPRAGTSDGSAASLASVTISRDGSTYFNNERVDDRALTARLATAWASNHDMDLIVSADRAATHGAVVHVMDLAKTVGITRFAISVERPDNAGP